MTKTNIKKDTGVKRDAGVAGIKIDEAKGQIQIELPYLDKHDLANFSGSDPFTTQYGGGSNSTFSSRSYTSPKSKISKAKEYFLKDSLARRIIELMAQFSATSVQLKGSQKYKGFFHQWLQTIGMDGVLKKIFKEYYQSSNVHTIKCQLPFKGTLKKGDRLILNTKGFKTDGKLGLSDLGTYKKDLAAEIQKGEVTDIAARKLNWTNKMIPWRYTVLNPLQIEKFGDSTFGLEDIFWMPSKNLRALIMKIEKDPKSRAKFEPILKSLPIMLYQQLKDNKSKVELFPHFHSAIYRMKEDSEPWAEPLMTPIFDHLFRKNQMREADIRVIKSVIDKILLIQVGSDKFPAKKEQLLALSSIFKDPSTVLELIWNHCIDIKWIDVKTEFLNEGKYKSVDRDIKEGFGITEILLGTTIDQKGNPFVSLRGLVENMADGQEAASFWLKEEFEEIGEALKLDNVPDPQLTTINLEDKVSLFKIYQGMVDRGILSNQTVCELIGDDWRRNIEQIKNESKMRIDGILPQIGSPYQKTGGGEPIQPGGEVLGEPKASTEKTPGVITPGEIKGAQGKPPGKQGPLEIPRKVPRMKAAASADEIANMKLLARASVKKLYEKAIKDGKNSQESYNEAATTLYKISTSDLGEFLKDNFQPNGNGIEAEERKRMVEDMREMVSISNSKWKRDNAGRSMLIEDSLDILADAWAACVPE